MRPVTRRLALVVAPALLLLATSLRPAGAGAAAAHHSAGRRAAAAGETWQPIPIVRWLGPLATAAQAAALTGRAVPGRDGPARWRPMPPALAAEAAARPLRLQALVERAGDGVVVVAGELCLAKAAAVRVRVTSAAAVHLAVDAEVVMRLRPWLAARPNLRPLPHVVRLDLTAGCHPVRIGLRSPSGHLTLALAWSPVDDSGRGVDGLTTSRLLEAAAAPAGGGGAGAGPTKTRAARARAEVKRVAALGQLAAIVTAGGARGHDHDAVQASLAAGRAVHPGAALIHALAQPESGDRIAALSVAGARWPHDVPLALALIRLLDEGGRAHEALRVWQARLAGAELRDAEACAAGALLWQRLDVPRAARALAAACATRFPAHPAGLQAVARLAVAAEDLVGAALARRALVRQAPRDPERWLDLLGAYAELGEGTALAALSQPAAAAVAPAQLRGALRRAPVGAQAWDLARARNALGLAWLRRSQPKRAETLLRGVPLWARRAFTLELLARALLAQSGPGQAARRAEAMSLLRESLRRAPNRQALRARLALLAPAQAFYMPHRRDLMRLARTAAAQPVPDVPFTQLLRQTVVRQLAPGRLARYEVALWRIGKGGPKAHDVEVDYVPSQTTPAILQAAIVRADGRVVRSVPQRLSSLSEGADGLYYDLEQITLAFADLRPGDVLVSAHTLRDFAPDPFGLVFGELFQLGDAWPVRETEIVLELDPAATPNSAWRRPTATKTAVVLRGVLRDEGLVVPAAGGPGQPGATAASAATPRWRRWRFSAGAMAAVPMERDMPGAAEVVDTLHVSTFTSWTAAAQWYAKMVADALPNPGSDEEVVKLAAKLSHGLTTPAAKTAAIYRWVADEIRYVGLEFGIHSLKPHDVREVLARRFGDCKDKATVLVALLAEVGVQAQVALVRTADSGKLRDGVASFGGFSHAIAWVPALGWWLDATLQHHQPTELPAGDVGGQALAIPRRANVPAALVDLPDAGASANRRVEHSHIQLSSDGGATLSLTVRAHGLPAATLRERLHAELTRSERVQSDLAARFPGVQVQQVTVSGVAPLADEVVVQVQATVPKLVHGGGDAWSWQPLVPESPWRKRASQVSARVHAYVGAYAWRDERHVVVSPPPGFRLQVAPQSRFQVGGLGSFKIEIAETTKGSWRLSRTVVRGKRVLPPESHAGLAAWLAQLDVALGLELRMLRVAAP